MIINVVLFNQFFKQSYVLIPICAKIIFNYSNNLTVTNQTLTFGAKQHVLFHEVALG